ncbi:50S ribosomal protein L6 [Patescibacteria group bacterium]|nr:50S ribosomal protein L6 [Patescibacteria group bacterium]
MSRIGKKPILIPENVEVKIEGQKVIVKGPKGELSKEVRPEIKVEIKGYNPPSTLPVKGEAPRKILVSPQRETKQTKAFWGLTRTLLANAIEGVTVGFEKKLQIEGLGFKANLEEDNLVLKVGFTNPIKLKTPEGMRFSIEKNIITVSGIDKELVGQVAAKIRKVKPPEPYKGKGIRYLGEVVRKKVGKKVAATTK